MHTNNRFSRLVLSVVLLCSFIVVKAADRTELYNAVQAAHRAGVEFSPIQLFTPATGVKHTDLRLETTLSVLQPGVQAVYSVKPRAINISFTTAEGKIYTLEMLRSNPLAMDIDAGYIDVTGRHKAAYKDGLHYQGAVKDAEHSLATMSVFANGEVMALFSTEEGNFVVGKLEDGSGNYILYNDADFLTRPVSSCAVRDDGPSEDAGSGNKTTAAYQCRKVSFYWEADNGLYRTKSSSLTNVQNYVFGMFNQVQAMYRNEKIAVELKSLYIWTTADGYDSTSSGAGLTSFQGAWNAVNDTFKGNIAMLLAKDPGGNGGVAYVNSVCNKSYAYAYCDVDGSYATIPTYSWDVEAVTHEIGHNLGSKHTHWCGWNTGAGGACGSIDNCVTQEASGSCTTCPKTYDNSLPASAWKGTVMSYCHLVSRGISLANGFGPLPGDRIRSVVSSASCLSSIISVTLTPKSICKFDGAVILTIDTMSQVGNSNFGTVPYTYVWSNTQTTQSIYNLIVPGTYVVIVTDSNGCNANFTTNVTVSTSDTCFGLNVNKTELNTTALQVYPNPANDVVTVSFAATVNSKAELKLTDMLGKAVIRKEIEQTVGKNAAEISVKDIAPGVYFLSLSAGEGQYKVVKLVIQ